MASAEVFELQERLRFDTPFWAENCAKILNARKQLIPLIPRPWQLELDRKLEEQRAKGEPMRGIIVKARKLGFSTWGMAKIAQRVTQLEYQHGIVVAQDTKTAGVLFDMAALMHAHLPDQQQLGLGFNIKPDVIGRSFSPNGRKYITFGERSRALREMGSTGSSTLEIDTAGSPEAGRGTTPSLVWCSEVAHWENQNKLLGLLNAVPDEPETLVVQESTANGLNDFHKSWTRAVEGEEDDLLGGRYFALFAPWWMEPAYALGWPEDQAESREHFVESIGQGPYGDDEPALVELYGCTPEQLRWRRATIREKTNDTIELFKQEYPANAEEAFIGSGRTVFSGVLVSRTISAAATAPEPVRGTLRPSGYTERLLRSGGTLRVPDGVLWVPEAERRRDEHLLEVWEHPVTEGEQALLPEGERRPEGAYVVAVDVAEGEANTFTQGDFHAIQVFDHRTRMQVAVHESRMDIHLLPLWTLLVAMYYNRAWLAPEVNGPGIALSEPLAKDYRYSRMYRRRRAGTSNDQVQEMLGWKTDKVTKPIIEASMGDGLQQGTHGIRHVRTARQLNTYVIDDKGRHGATDGEHDDLLLAAMIAHGVMDVLRPPRMERKKRTRRLADDITGY